MLGFNTHFYPSPGVLICGSLASGGQPGVVPPMARRRPLLAGSFLCMASGARPRRGDRSPSCADRVQSQGRTREWLGIAALGAITLVLARVVLHAAGSGGLGAHSPGEFAAAFFHFASWPPPFPLGLVIAAPLIFCIITLADRPALTDPRWFNVGAYGWMLTQFLALAAGRAEIGVQSRYSDTLLIGLMINLTSAFWLSASATRAAKGRIWPYLVGGVAGRRRGVVGSRSAPCARRPGQLAAHHRDRGKKCAGLSRRRKRIGSRRRPASGNPLFRIEALCANCSTRRRFAPRCRRSSCRGTLRELGSRRSRGLSSGKASPCSGPAFCCSPPSSRGGAARPPGWRIPRTLPIDQGNRRFSCGRACCLAPSPERRC